MIIAGSVSLFFFLLVGFLIRASERMLAREKIDPEYAAKRDRFRDKAEKFIPSQNTVYIIVATLFVLGYFISLME